MLNKLTPAETQDLIKQASESGTLDPERLVQLVQVAVEQKNAFAWPSIEDYEADIGYKVGMPVRIGWDMARTTNSIIKQLAENSDSSDSDENDATSVPAP